MSALSRHKVYQLLLPRVIDVKYGCFTFLLLHLHGLRIVYTVVKLINNQWKSWRWFEYQKTLQRSYIKHAAQCVTQYLSSRHLKVSLNNQYHMPRFSTCFSVSSSSDETCVVIDELHLNVFAITGPSALKVWASSWPTFWRILFWEGISFRKNKTIHKMRWFFSSLLLTTILKLVFFFQKKEH